MKKENIIKEQMPATDFDDMWEKLYFILTGFDHFIQSYDFFLVSQLSEKNQVYDKLHFLYTLAIGQSCADQSVSKTFANEENS